MRILVILLLALLPAMSFANDYEPKDRFIAGKCQLTPSMHHADDYPGRKAIITSNKLALPAGKSEYAKGELLYISGRVLDQNCVPVSDAIVEIWQANPQGKYVKPTLSGRMSSYPYFTGTGRAVTDNLGQFNFVTLYPGAEYRKKSSRSRKNRNVDYRAPHIHVRILHRKFATLNTEMLFEGDKLNVTDPWFNMLKPDQQPLIATRVWQRPKPEDGLATQWDITLRGKNQYRKF